MSQVKREVKADSKGRITGASPGEEYIIWDDGMGSFTASPKKPRVFEDEREVSYDQFVQFFGVPPEQVNVEGLQTVRVAKSPDHYPYAIAFQKYRHTETGERVYTGPGKRMSGVGSSIKEDVLIKVKTPKTTGEK